MPEHTTLFLALQAMPVVYFVKVDILVLALECLKCQSLVEVVIIALKVPFVQHNMLVLLERTPIQQAFQIYHLALNVQQAIHAALIPLLPLLSCVAWVTIAQQERLLA
jgi:hypothetical protein